jgi:hypothetical protein
LNLFFNRLLPALSRGLKQFFREHLPKIEMEAEKLERFKRTVLSDKELYVAFSDVQMRYKYVILKALGKFSFSCLDFVI